MPKFEPLLPAQPEEPDEDTAEWRDQAGDRDANDGNFSRAIGHYKRAAKLGPSSRRVTRVADAYVAADLPEKALEYYEKALAMNGADPEAHAGIGDLCIKMAMSAHAIIAFERAVRCNPRRAFFRFRLAVALATMGRFERAAQELGTAVELSPRAPYYRFLLADVYLQLERIEEAIAELEQVVKLAPRDEYYQVRLGAACLRAGRYDSAIEAFEATVALQPRNLSYRRLLGYACQLGGRPGQPQALIDDGALDAYDQDYVRRVEKLARNGN